MPVDYSNQSIRTGRVGSDAGAHSYLKFALGGISDGHGDHRQVIVSDWFSTYFRKRSAVFEFSFSRAEPILAFTTTSFGLFTMN